MSANKNFSNHLDRSVVLMFLGFFLVSAGTVTYQFINQIPCSEVLFSMNAKEYRAGEMIKFQDDSPNAEEWEWVFGDSTEVSTVKNPLHIFDKEGEYKVKLKINKICERIETVVIKEKLIVLDSTKFPVFELPNKIRVGQVLSVKDETDNASTWEWRFGETSRIDADTKRAEYVFKEAGLKTVSLVVNGDVTYIKKKKIEVTPRPEDKTEIVAIEQPKREKNWNIKDAPEISDAPKSASTGSNLKPNSVPYISEKEFSRKILLVSNEKLNAKAFTEFFCGDINKNIVVNGKNTTFLVFCEKIEGKKIKLKELNLFRDKGSNCIKNVTVEYKKSGWF